MHLPYLAISSLVSLLLIRIAITLIQRARSPLSSVPGPWYTQWTSAVLDYQWLAGRRALYVERMHRKYGRVVRLSPSEVDFSSITAAKQIYSYNRPLLKSNFYNAFGNIKGPSNVFSTQDVVFHARHRRLLSAPLSESSLKSVEHIVRGRAEFAVQQIGAEMKKNGCADVLKWWLFMATDIMGELSFGDSFRMLEQGKQNQYALDLHQVAFFDGLRAAFPTMVKLAFFLPLPLFTEVLAGVRRMRLYAKQSIQRYEKMVAADPWNPKPTLFTKLFKAGEEGMPQEEIVAEAQTYIIAGSDTTANGLTYLVFAVCRDDSIKQRLAQEVAGLPDEYGDDDLKALPYLNQVIYETLRLYAPAPSGLPRDVPAGGCKIDGYWMPGGATVCTQAFSMHRDPILYPEPERFYPSRWERPSKEMEDAWMPFGGGARVCLGLHLVWMELRYATAKFFTMFPNARVSSREGFCEDDMEQVIYFLTFPKIKRCLIQAS